MLQALEIIPVQKSAWQAMLLLCRAGSGILVEKEIAENTSAVSG